jgi:hypothetical protein
MALILKTDGSNEVITSKKLSLEQLQKIVGGYIEIVKIPYSKNFLIINEEGIMYNLPVNNEATKLFKQQIVGNVVMCTKSEI